MELHRAKDRPNLHQTVTREHSKIIVPQIPRFPLITTWHRQTSIEPTKHLTNTTKWPQELIDLTDLRNQSKIFLE